MKPAVEVARGTWWRFNRYEVREGYVRPTTESKLSQYNPWENYWQSCEAPKVRPRPYRELLALLKPPRVIPSVKRSTRGQMVAYDHVGDAATEEWCQKHGLLGLMVHQVETVVLAPRWEKFLVTRTRPPLSPTLRQYFRTGFGWRLHVESPFPARHVSRTQGQLVAKDDIPAGWPHPGVLIRDLETGRLRKEPFGATWARYFPQVSSKEWETFEYPQPLSEAFWRSYAEPIDAFLNAIVTLQRTLDRLEDWISKRRLSQVAKYGVRIGIETLHSHVAPLSMALRPERDRTFGVEWIAPSLLSTFAMMMHLDVAQESALVQCETCGRIFISDARQRKYCSIRCRNTALKRRYRKNSLRKKQGGTNT